MQHSHISQTRSEPIAYVTKQPDPAYPVTNVVNQLPNIPAPYYTTQPQPTSHPPTAPAPTKMGDHTLFFYGTLLAPPVLHRVIYGTSHPNSLTHPAMTLLKIQPALLRGYSRHRVEMADYPAIIPDPNGTVRGSVVSGLTEGDVYRLDVFEGVQYVKRGVEVEVLGEGVGVFDKAPEGEGDAVGTGTGSTGNAAETQVPETVQAQTYVWCADEAYLEKAEWDFEDFKRHKMRRWMGAPPGEEDAWSNYGGDEQDGKWKNHEMEDEGGEVQVDEGFADVDRAVRELQEKERKTEKVKRDPTGGRGVNGVIGRQLEEVQRNGGGNGNGKGIAGPGS